VIKVDPQTGKISLSLKQVLPDPWTEVPHRYRIGEVVRGKVVRLAPSGAFVRLGDVDGFLPASEVAERRVSKLEEVLQPGQQIEAMIIELRPEQRRMVLSVRRLTRERERQQLMEYQQTQVHSGRVTIGDVAGDLLRQALQGGKESGEEPGSS
jgi:4-hydroxy-3-methylbut-2-enyl diphosphate reductase